ncbi:MAG: ABC transporter-like protein, ABC-2 type transport system ATP-binding protein [Microgenomates group bacterium GW2011_GWC1_41_20]|uniref:ABC transporter related protein n=1 Tax=Candidatus Woesebacteria bacterium GW2011_GWE1_41_24 TaxID=1618597 RepID=A0A0G0W1E9_9BACT|nr:MAG: ABC transporter-like protein, ABC-2 type transport system ATP-binding protein [Microgenomates group bacterium GW2011_GWC1_41_20]KKS05757.1 MAG: ABC transporter related protein [Candidatus Woesebacteria bacterium GW2011_GWE1_41_24]
MDRAIVVDNLVKKFEVTEKAPGLTGSIKSLISPKKKIITALRGISFAVQPGELVGFIGPNGAGKTTTLKILSGLLYPTEGFVGVMEFDPWKRNPEFLKQISLVMGQKNQLWWDLPAIETFELNRAIYEIPTRTYSENLKELVELLGIGKLLNTPVRKLSLGQRMRMELTAALLHKPKVLFLDEPTIGLDIIAQQKIRDFIYEYNTKYGATILLTSHNMDDLTNLARRVIIINDGRILYDGAFEELITKFAKEKLIKARLSNENNISDLERIGKIKKLSFPEVVLSVPRSAAAVAASELLQNFPVDDLTIEEIPIEEVIRKAFKGGSGK